MKKLAILVLIALCIFSMTACNLTNTKTHIDCNWEALRDLSPTPILPIASNAETGEPISSEPAGPWSGPAD